jgi:hypothetical protein
VLAVIVHSDVCVIYAGVVVLVMLLVMLLVWLC